MGMHIESLTDFGFEIAREEIIRGNAVKIDDWVHRKRIRGQCPKCKAWFDQTFNILYGGDKESSCICGYFTIDAKEETVIYDGHNISEKEWKQRRAEAEKQ